MTPRPDWLPNWLIYFEDAAIKPEIYTEEPRERYAALMENWNCHLFRRVEPPPLKINMRPAVIPPYPKADEPGGIGWATTMRVFDVDIDNDIYQKEEPRR